MLYKKILTNLLIIHTFIYESFCTKMVGFPNWKSWKRHRSDVSSSRSVDCTPFCRIWGLTIESTNVGRVQNAQCHDIVHVVD